MVIQRQEDVTGAVLAVMERTDDPRLREIMVSPVRHLHTVLLAGSFTRPVPVAAGDVIHADYGPLGAIGVSFA